MKNKMALASALGLAGVLVLAGCGDNAEAEDQTTTTQQAEDFTSDAQRDLALHDYVCEQMESEHLGSVFKAALDEYKKLPESQREIGELEMVSQMMRANEGNIEDVSCDTSSPWYRQWVIEGYTLHVEREGFDYDTAKSAGVID